MLNSRHFEEAFQLITQNLCVKMNVFSLCHYLCVGMAAIEVVLCLLPRRTDGSMAISQASQMRYYSFQGTRQQINTPSTTRVLPGSTQQTIHDIRLQSRKASLALDFIENVRCKSEFRRLNCDRQKTGITLKDFDLKLSKAHFLTVFGNAANTAVHIANILTRLFLQRKDVDIKQFNTSQMPFIETLLKLGVENDETLSAAGIAFTTGFFPYVFKTTKDKTANLTTVQTKFSDLEFFATLQKRNYSNLWSSYNSQSGSNVTINVTEGHWAGPYFDCRNLQQWILTFSVPFFRLVKNKPAFR